MCARLATTFVAIYHITSWLQALLIYHKTLYGFLVTVFCLFCFFTHSLLPAFVPLRGDNDQGSPPPAPPAPSLRSPNPCAIISPKNSYACPNGCSGHGQCRSMREMGVMGTATPLTNVTATSAAAATVHSDAEGFEVSYGGWHSPPGSATWDSNSVYGCVCDSSWEVCSR